MTTLPGIKSSCSNIILMSGVYMICVRCGSVSDHNSGVGCNTCPQPFDSSTCVKFITNFVSIQIYLWVFRNSYECNLKISKSFFL